MNHRHVEEHNLVERYVLGRLSEEEQASFEDHFADCRQCQEQLELAEDLAAALPRAAAPATSPETRRSRTAVAAPHPRPAQVRPWALPLAAGLAAALLLPILWLGVENRRLAAEIDALRQPLAAVPGLLLTTTRDGVREAPALTPEPGEPWVSLALEVVPDPAIGSYEASLVTEDGRLLWQEDGLQANPWGVLQVTFPTALLPPGAYRLEVTARGIGGRAEPLDSFPFRVTAPGEASPSSPAAP